jgi:hypothetical protein
MQSSFNKDAKCRAESDAESHVVLCAGKIAPLQKSVQMRVQNLVQKSMQMIMQNPLDGLAEEGSRNVTGSADIQVRMGDKQTLRFVVEG